MKRLLIFGSLTLTVIASLVANAAQPRMQTSLWQVYQQSLEGAKYVDLTHTITPSMPVWQGFAAPKFAPTVNPKTGTPYIATDRKLRTIINSEYTRFEGVYRRLVLTASATAILTIKMALKRLIMIYPQIN